MSNNRALTLLDATRRDGSPMMSLVQPTRLFVYGTLKRGLPGEPHMSGSRFEGPATTGPGYALYDLGPYPALVITGDETVTGELYWVSPDHLARLDEYEECPSDYTREKVVLADGSLAEAYVMSLSRVTDRSKLAGGVWRASDRRAADF